MKRITYADNQWMLGDEVAEVLFDYAVLLARTESADSIEVIALDGDGIEVPVSFLVGPATMMTAAGVPSDQDEPDNTEAVSLMRERIRMIESPPSPIPVARPHDWEGLE